MATKSVHTTFQSRSSTNDLNGSTHNGFHNEIDSLETMLKEMRENHNKILKEYFHGDKDNMLSHVNQMLDDDDDIPDTTLVALPNHPPMSKDTSTSGSALKELGDHYEVEIDTNGYQPDEITVKTVDNMVAVEGKHEEKSEGKSYVSRKFSRKFSLPPNVDPERVIPSLDKSGMLKITAHKAQKMIEADTVETDVREQDRKQKQETEVKVNRGEQRRKEGEENSNSQKSVVSTAQATVDSGDPVRALIQRMNERQQNILQKHYRGDSEEMMRHCKRLVQHQLADDPFVRLYTRSLSNNAQQDVSQNPNEMIIKLDVKQFASKEISVKTQDQCLVVEAKHNDTDGTVMRHVIKKYQLPEDVRATEITSRMKDDTLMIQIPRHQQFKGRERIVPITVSDGQKKSSEPTKRYKSEIVVSV